MDLSELTIVEAQVGLKKEKFSASELLKACLNKLEKLDPQIKAFVTVESKTALSEARKLEKREKQNLPLGGIPLVIKDNFLTQGIRTTASSKVLENYLPVYEATVVERLKKAGAIIFAKTNMDAWAHGSSTETSQFFTTRNPWNLDFLPGGSSGGSAAAVAADMTIGAIGSETAGSIRQPAAWCGVVGFKPTYGVVSRWGLIAMASSLDCPGPICKTVEDAKILFEVLRGKDPRDATSVEFKAKKMPQKMKEIKIGVAKEYFFPEIQKEVKEKVLDALQVFKSMGAKIQEVALLDPQQSVSVYTLVQRSEVSSNLARYDGIRYGRGRDTFGDEAKRRIMLGTYSLSSGYYEAFYLRAEKVRTLIVRDFEKIFKEIDVLLAPTTPSTALPVGATKGEAMFGELQDILVEASSLAGLPGISFNVGFSQQGLPIGLQLIGPAFSENLLFYLGEKYQSVTSWHQKKPKV